MSHILYFFFINVVLRNVHTEAELELVLYQEHYLGERLLAKVAQLHQLFLLMGYQVGDGLDVNGLEAVESADANLQILKFGHKMVAGTQRLFVKILALGSYVLFEGDLVVGEEHEVIDEDLCGLLQGILGRDGPVGGDLKYQGLIVGLLLYAAVFPAIVDILDGSVD